jgi:hypothetical protein
MSSTEQLSQLLGCVSDEKSFLRFVEALIADGKSSARAQKENPASPWGSDAGGWENTSIDFLEAATAWARRAACIAFPKLSHVEWFAKDVLE